MLRTYGAAGQSLAEPGGKLVDVGPPLEENSDNFLGIARSAIFLTDRFSIHAISCTSIR